MKRIEELTLDLPEQLKIPDSTEMTVLERASIALANNEIDLYDLARKIDASVKSGTSH